MPTSQIISAKLLFVLSIVLLLILLSLNLALGSVDIPITDVIHILFEKKSDNIIWENILIRTRFPQTLTALGAGMGLGIAGLLMQTLFRNPLAGPSVLGISSGASLGVAFVLLVAGHAFSFSMSQLGLWGDLAVAGASLGGAMAVLLIILLISKKIGGTLSVLIMGVMIGYLSNSIVGILKYYSLEEDVQNYVVWGLGSFSRLSLEQAGMFVIVTIILSAGCLLLSKPLNLLALGDHYASNLGLNIKKARFFIIFSSGILTAWVTAFCGPIIFIGLAVPHLAKMTSRTSNHFTLIISSCIIGGTTALLCNLIARLPGLESELPINSVTAFIGAPVIISVILRRRKEKIME